MNEVKLGEKGQITLPKAVRDRYNLSKGDEIRLIDLGNGIMEMILLSHSAELPPPAIRTNQKVTDARLRAAAQVAARKRFERSAK